MLGGVSGAYAQEGAQEGAPSASERGSAAAQERSPSPNAGVSNRSAGGDEGSGASGKTEDGQKGNSAERSERSNEKGTTGRATQDADSGNKSSNSTAKSDTDNAERTGREGSDTTDNAAATKDSTGKTDRSATDMSKGTSTDGSRDDKSAATKESNPSEKADRSATDTSNGTANDRSAESKASGDKVKHVDLSGDKRTKVQSAFRDAGNVKHRTDLNIDISVGRRLPRDWDFAPVPTAVIGIVPEYRDYYFAYVGDEYVIVEPNTYEVVAVLPAERSQAGSSSGRQAGGQCSAQLTLSSKERELILDNVRGGREADVSDISVGRAVPKGIELQRFPDGVLAEAKALEGCQYFDAGGEIAIVDPNEDKIVLIIDKS